MCSLTAGPLARSASAPVRAWRLTGKSTESCIRELTTQVKANQQQLLRRFGHPFRAASALPGLCDMVQYLRQELLRALRGG